MIVKENPKSSSMAMLDAAVKRVVGSDENPGGTVANFYERGPIQTELNKLLLQAFELPPGERSGFLAKADAKYAEFDENEADQHSAPPWIRKTMQACIAITFGYPDHALLLDREALPLARKPWQVAISNANIADSLNKMREYEPARGYAMKACEIDGFRNPTFVGYLAIALHGSGQYEALERLVSTLPRVLASPAQREAWTAFVQSYQEFGDMAREFEWARNVGQIHD